MDAEHMNADVQRIVLCSSRGCCNGGCREGRDCPLRNVKTRDGGQHVDGFKVFPLTVDRAERMPERFRTRRKPDPFLFAAVTVARYLPAVFVALAVATFFVEIWKGKP